MDPYTRGLGFDSRSAGVKKESYPFTITPVPNKAFLDQAAGMVAGQLPNPHRLREVLL